MVSLYFLTMEIKPKILRRPDVERLVCLKRSAIYRLMAEDLFPKPVRIGPRAVAWRISDIEAWLRERGVK